MSCKILFPALTMAALCAAPARAQQAPPPAGGQAMGTSKDRLLWVVPNYGTVDLGKSLPTITPKDKLAIGVQDATDPYAFALAGMYAAIDHVQDRPVVWGRGTGAYGKRYVASLANQTISDLMVLSVFPIALRQDPRYLRLGSGGFWRRAGYAAGRIFVTRGDNGRAQFNWSEVGGNAVMAGGANLYTPDRGLSASAARFGLELAIDGIGNLGREFWPDVRDWLTRGSSE